MPFSAHDLRYQAEKTYPALYSFLHQRAQHFLGSLRYDAYEVDQVVSHVVEQLIRLGLLGSADQTAEGVLDKLTPAQFYAFLNRSIKNKAIDRLRKRRLQVSTFSELGTPDDAERDEDFLNDIVDPGWTPPPFSTPEETAITVSSLQELRRVIITCLENLQAAPRQLQAILEELEAFGADELLDELREHIQNTSSLNDEPLAHSSQHKDHAHKKLRHCLQKSSTNLAVMVAFRLIEYKGIAASSEERIELQALTQNPLSDYEVREGLTQLTARKYLNWHGENYVRCSPSQKKALARFYQEEE